MESQLSKKTVFDFLSGHATPLQKKLIEEWLQHTHHKEQYYEWLDEYQREHPQINTDTEEALQHYFDRIEAAEEPTPAEEQVRRKTYPWLWAAAVTLLMLSFVGRDLLYTTYTTDFGEVRTLTLEDGSTVTLNANSSLQVSRFQFGRKARKVCLSGEAEFSITHTQDHTPFLVETPDELEVEVLGTEFVVSTRARGSQVALHKGSVRLRSLDDTLRKPLTIKPGEVVTIPPKGAFQLQRNQPTGMYSAWKNHQYIFYHTSMREIASRIEDNFGMKVQITDSTLAARELTGTYEAANVKELLTLLAAVLDIHVSQDGKQIILSKK